MIEYNKEQLRGIRIFFRIISNSIRANILKYFRDMEITDFTLIKNRFCLPNSTLRYHLNKLTDAGIIYTPDGYFYEITNHGRKILIYIKKLGDLMAKFDVEI